VGGFALWQERVGIGKPLAFSRQHDVVAPEATDLEPTAIDRTTAARPDELPRAQAAVAFWLSKKYRVAPEPLSVLVSEAYHPFWKHWWPQGHMIGWEHTFIHEIAHLLDAIVNDTEVGPHGATFDDGYKNAVICDAILQSAADGRHVDVRY